MLPGGLGGRGEELSSVVAGRGPAVHLRLTGLQDATDACGGGTGRGASPMAEVGGTGVI